MKFTSFGWENNAKSMKKRKFRQNNSERLDLVSLHRQLSALHELSKVYELWTFCTARKQECPHFFPHKYVDWY